MTKVKFIEVNTEDSSDYIFADSSGVKYHLYSDERSRDVSGISPDFWDKFYFCKKIDINYLTMDDAFIISKINSYK